MTESFIELGESAQVQSKELSQTVWYASYLTSRRRSVTDEHYVLKWQRHWRLIPILTYLEDLWRGAAHRLLRLTPTMILILWVLIVSSGRAWRAGTSNGLLIFCLRRRSSRISFRHVHPTLVVFGSVWTSTARKPSKLY